MQLAKEDEEFDLLVEFLEPLRQCTSDCRQVGCPEEDICTYCGENKWENRDKHFVEMTEFLQKEYNIIKDFHSKNL